MMQDKQPKSIDLDGAELPSFERTVNEARKLDDDPNDAPLPPSSLHFRSHRSLKTPFWQKPKFIGSILLLVIVGVSVAVIRKEPKLRRPVLKGIRLLSALSTDLGMGDVTKPVLLKAHAFFRGSKTGASEITNGPSLDTDKSCGTYIRSALDKKIKNNLQQAEWERLLSCELFQDSFRLAQRELEQRKIELKTGNTWLEVPVQLMALEIARQHQPMRMQPLFSKQDCLRWQAQPDCLLRYVDEAHLPFHNNWRAPAKLLEAEIDKQPRLSQTWFHLATGLHARRDKAFVEAQAAFDKAALQLKEEDPFLAREVYRSALVNAVLANDQSLFARAVALKPDGLYTDDPRAFLDSEVMVSLLSGTLNHEEMKTYFSSPESLQRFSKDPAVLKILLTRTQLFDLELLGLTVSERLFGKAKEVDPALLGESLSLLYARILIGGEKYLDAAALLSACENRGFRSAEVYHLRGLAQLGAFRTREPLMGAAKDFQTAMGLQKSEASLLGQTLALLEAGAVPKVQQTLQNWKALYPASKEGWYELAEGLLAAHSGSSEEAMAAFTRGQAKAPKRAIWAKIQHNLGEDSEYLKTDLYRRLRLILSADSPIGSLALFGQKP